MIAMNGTSFSVTEAILLRPPTITRAARIIRRIPVTMLGTPKAVFILTAIELIWPMLPIPKEANIQNILKRTASIEPIYLHPGFEPSPSLR